MIGGIDYGSPCTPACWAMPTCDVCGKTKAPSGRSVAPAAAGGYCHPTECAGYVEEPAAGHYWFGEECDNAEGREDTDA